MHGRPDPLGLHVSVLERLMKQLQGVYVRVIDAYNKDECDVMEQGIGEFKKAQGRKELEDMPQLGQVLKWIGELEPLVGAKVRKPLLMSLALTAKPEVPRVVVVIAVPL